MGLSLHNIPQLEQVWKGGLPPLQIKQNLRHSAGVNHPSILVLTLGLAASCHLPFLKRLPPWSAVTCHRFVTVGTRYVKREFSYTKTVTNPRTPKGIVTINANRHNYPTNVQL